MISKNMGTTDRFIRIVIALVLAWLGMNQLTGIMQTLAYVFAGIAFLTSISGYCPLYSCFGCSTGGCCGTCKGGKCECNGKSGSCKHKSMKK